MEIKNQQKKQIGCCRHGGGEVAFWASTSYLTFHLCNLILFIFIFLLLFPAKIFTARFPFCPYSLPKIPSPVFFLFSTFIYTPPKTKNFFSLYIYLYILLRQHSLGIFLFHGWFLRCEFTFLSSCFLPVQFIIFVSFWPFPLLLFDHF